MSVVLAVATAAACAAPTGATDAQTQYEAYIQRSLAIVAAAKSQNRDTLGRLIAGDAKFALISGDVVVPLGVGAEGAFALGQRLAADAFRYPGWDYMNFRQDACAPIEVTIEFTETDGAGYSNVTFSFRDGLLVSAGGRRQGLISGRLSEVPSNG